MINTISRRLFLKVSVSGAGAAIVSSGISACGDDGKTFPFQATFDHGIASGDPLTNSVIIWTRATPESSAQTEVEVGWEVGTDEDFVNLVNRGSTTTNADRDFTIKVDVQDLEPGTQYYYRFSTGELNSELGMTKTLPEGDLDRVKLAAISCSNITAGYFHVYSEIAKREYDAVLHLGDYIYEYGEGGYPQAEGAKDIDGRGFEPPKEILQLEDYRTRYAQYRSDQALQAAHASAPFILVWDDHEVTNDTWREGAENHQPDEGDFEDRKLRALQVYFEWMPIRPARPDETENEDIYRSFKFGNLVDLHMLDTRLIGRDQQLVAGTYLAPLGEALAQYNAAVTAPDTDIAEAETAAVEAIQAALSEFRTAYDDPERTLLGPAQRDWLLDQLQNSTGTWQVLGQQVLLGRMQIPLVLADPALGTLAAVALGLRDGVAEPTPLAAGEYVELLQAPSSLLAQTLVAAFIPYNLDAWDGYGADRDAVLQAAQDAGQNLVVLSGDTHNAWASNLRSSPDATSFAGVEFATASVASPGLEAFFGLTTQEAVDATAEGFVQLIRDLQYANWFDRGFIEVTFTPEKVQSNYVYVSNILETSYEVNAGRGQSFESLAGAPGLVASTQV